MKTIDPSDYIEATITGTIIKVVPDVEVTDDNLEVIIVLAVPWWSNLQDKVIHYCYASKENIELAKSLIRQQVKISGLVNCNNGPTVEEMIVREIEVVG